MNESASSIDRNIAYLGVVVGARGIDPLRCRLCHVERFLRDTSIGIHPFALFRALKCKLLASQRTQRVDTHSYVGHDGRQKPHAPAVVVVSRQRYRSWFHCALCPVRRVEWTI